ncbi:hypothetical protein GGI07_005635 [Coemansia sp. Benny D115]|nr:hypothetical protein GGI07_005635 [Coemansia sp. Benny D115]
MEAYIQNIQSQVFPLTVLDTQASFSNIPFVFFFENTTGNPEFMSTDSLYNSFFRTMQEMPIFGGRVTQQCGGQINVVVNKDDINMPDYRETQSNVPFKVIKADNFNWRSWPQGVNTAGPMTRSNADGEIKLINVHVVRLKDNSGVMIYVSMVHYVVDGPAHMDVINRWCEIHRLMISGNEEKISSMKPFTADRDIVKQSLPAERSPIDAETSDTFQGFSILAEWAAWISPQWRGTIISKVVERQNTETHIFHVSRVALQRLRDELSEYVSDIDNVADNDLILSLATKTMAQSQRIVEERAKGIVHTGIMEPRDGVLPMAIIFEVRDHLGLSDKHYLGNVLIPKIKYTPLRELESPTDSKSMSRMLAEYSHITKRLTPAQIATHADMVIPYPSSFAKPIVRFLGHKSALSFVYDIMPNMYVADFGEGTPVWVSPIQPFRANATLLLTPKDPTDGVDVFLTAFPDVMKEVFKNEYFVDYAKCIY